MPKDASDQDRRIGLAALEALQKSPLAKRSEAEFVASVVDAVTLDPLGDGAVEDDWEAVADHDDPAGSEA